jgi:hypothetical protein
MRKPPGIDGRTAWRISADSKSSVPLSVHALMFPAIRYQHVDETRRVDACLLLRRNIMRCNISCDSSAPFGQQQLAAIADRDLRCFRKSLQQPWQRDFDPDMIIGDIEMA